MAGEGEPAPQTRSPVSPARGSQHAHLWQLGHRAAVRLEARLRARRVPERKAARVADVPACLVLEQHHRAVARRQRRHQVVAELGDCLRGAARRTQQCRARARERERELWSASESRCCDRGGDAHRLDPRGRGCARSHAREGGGGEARASRRPTCEMNGETLPSVMRQPFGFGVLAMSRCPALCPSDTAPVAHVGGLVRGRYMMPAHGLPRRSLKPRRMVTCTSAAGREERARAGQRVCRPRRGAARRGKPCRPGRWQTRECRRWDRRRR